MLVTVDFEKLHELQSINNKYIDFYEPFYNYPNHTEETIKDIFKVKEKDYCSDPWDKLIFDLNNKEELKPIFEKAVKSNPEYKVLLDNIIESEDIDYVIFYLYKKNDVKPIIEKVSNSNPKYKEKLNSIIEYESQ